MPEQKKNVVISLLGLTRDAKGKRDNRWSVWRPNVSLVMQDDFQVDRLELLYHPDHLTLAHSIRDDIQEASPSTDVVFVEAHWENPWDFAEVYSWFYDYARQYPVDIDHESYYFNITTGTHVHQICMFLISEAHLLPAKILQVSPDFSGINRAKGELRTIDLDLEKYDVLAKRFFEEAVSGQEYLKAGIQTRNVHFNKMIEEIERVALRSSDPILLEGPTGAGKSQLARRIYELKANRGKVTGQFIPVNCATLKGEGAMSALFGHTRGAFTGAQGERNGYLRQADKGILFLDEIGELGIDEQAMLLHAIEEKKFYPLGSDKTVNSNFQLLAGTNKDLRQQVREGLFREDLLARIDTWCWRMPALRERLEDLEANIDFELKEHTKSHNRQVRFNQAARQQYLKFAMSPDALWSSNFRDLNASIKRMVTLSEAGRINEQNVQHEIGRLSSRWKNGNQSLSQIDLSSIMTAEKLEKMDRFDQMQLINVITVCRNSRSLAEAGRVLFNVSRKDKASTNDSHRLRTYLKKYNLDFKSLLETT